MNKQETLEEPKQDYSGVHLRHCYQGEYEDGCKYGENDCPAKPLEPKQETLEDELWGSVFAKIKQHGLNYEVLTFLKQNFNISKR
jgi:hypothetical protein